MSLLDFPLPTEPCPPGKASIREWEAEHAREFGEASPWDESAVWADLGPRLRHELDESSVGAATTRFAGRDLAEEMLRAGATLAEVAAAASVRVEQVARLFVRAGEDVQDLLDFEQEARKQDWPSAAELARRVGWSKSRTEQTLILLGIKSPVAERRKAGGGLKYTAEQYALIEQRAKQGVGAGRIAKELAIPYTSVYRIIKRKGWA